LWANRIDRHYSDRIDIAVKRTLSSLTTRWDAMDRLIDAMVALENLFGTGSGELAFRISAGCAHLVERAPVRRVEIQKEVARLYTVRSRIVHGAHAPAPSDVDPDARAASDFAVRSLRALFLRRPELIDATDRARRLILGNAQ
jgi:Apea-like HEPN